MAFGWPDGELVAPAGACRLALPSTGRPLAPGCTCPWIHCRAAAFALLPAASSGHALKHSLLHAFLMLCALRPPCCFSGCLLQREQQQPEHTACPRAAAGHPGKQAAQLALSWPALPCPALGTSCSTDAVLCMLCCAVQAEDDPIAPKEAIPFKALQANPQCLLVTTPTGGHLGWCGGVGGITGARQWREARAGQSAASAILQASLHPPLRPVTHHMRPPPLVQARPGRMLLSQNTSLRHASCSRSLSLRQRARRRASGSRRLPSPAASIQWKRRGTRRPDVC